MFRVSSTSAGHWHGPVNTPAAFLEGFEDDGLAGEIEALGRECQRFGDTAAGVMQNEAKGAHLARGDLGRIEEGRALLTGQIQAVALGVEQYSGPRI